MGKVNEFSDGELGPVSFPPSSLPLDPRNLMADLIEFASVVMQDIKDSKFSPTHQISPFKHEYQSLC